VGGSGAVQEERQVALVKEKQEGGLQRWVRETNAELRKVTWPTREEALRLTYVVIGLSLAMGLLLGGADFILGSLYAFLVR
jgi:preprotein translocase subunit SecE